MTLCGENFIQIHMINMMCCIITISGGFRSLVAFSYCHCFVCCGVDVSIGKEVPFDILTAEAGPGQTGVNVTSPSGAPLLCSITPTLEGASAKFVPTEAGPHNVQVTFAEQPVPGSPFTTTATAVMSVIDQSLNYLIDCY